MNYKKTLLYGSVCGLLILGAGYRYWYPMLRANLQEKITEYMQEYAEEEIQKEQPIYKATRSIPKDADVGAYLAGMTALKARDYADAAAYFEKVYTADRENLIAASNLMVLYTIMGDVEQAVPYARQINKLVSNEADTQSRTTDSLPVTDETRGERLNRNLSAHILTAHSFKNQDYQSVLDYYTGKKATATDIVIQPIVEAWSYAGLNQQEKAFAMLDTMKDKRLFGVQQYHKALLYTYFGNREQAKEIYRSLDMNQILSVNMIVSMADVFQGTPEWTRGQPVYERYMMYLKTRPQVYDLLRQVGVRPIRTPQQAVADIYQTIALALAGAKFEDNSLLFNGIACYLDEESMLLKISLAEVYQQMGLNDLANDVYRSIQPSSDIIRFKVGLNLISAHEYQAALDVFLDLEKRNQKNYLIQELLGDIYQNLHESDLAIQHYERSAELLRLSDQKIGVAEALVRIVQVYESEGQKEKVIPILRKALAHDNENVFVLNYLGYELIDQEVNVDEGLRYVQKAQALSPEDPYITDSLAWGYYKKGEYESALKYALEAAEGVYDNAIVYAHLGDIYRALGRKLEAEAQYRKALVAKKENSVALKDLLRQKIISLRGEKKKVMPELSESANADKTDSSLKERDSAKDSNPNVLK